MITGDDVVSQLGRRKISRIRPALGRLARLGLKLLNHCLQRNGTPPASLGEGGASLTTKVDAEALEYPGTSRSFGDQIANSSPGKRCAGWGYKECMFHDKDNLEA